MSLEDFEKLMQPMLDEAESKGLWFYCDYQGINKSPKEIREEWKNGSYRWGPVNWRLIDPKTLLKDEEKEIQKIINYNKQIKGRMQ